MIRRPLRHARNRRQLDVSNVPQGASVTATATLVAGKVRLALNQPCSLDGLPALSNTGGAHPTAGVMLTPVLCELTYAVAPVVGNTVTLPDRDPALRAYNGGYVAAFATTF